MLKEAPQSQVSDKQMEHRRLGQTSLYVSIVGFGASPLGNVFRQTDPTEGIAAVHEAIELGINFFDVSPYYGLTVAETRLGEALEGRRKDVVLATKCGRYNTDEFDFSEARITRGLEESLQRLKTDHVDLLQAHDVEFGDVTQIVNETIPALRKLQQQGKTRFVGITGYSLANLKAIAEQAQVDSILTYCRYNLLIDDMQTSLIPFAKAHEIGIVNASALHMGILTERGAPSWHPAPKQILDAGQRVVALCKERGVDPAELALRYCFDNPDVASTLVGMSTPDHVRQNLRALRLEYDPKILEEIRDLVDPVFNYRWISGRPENQG